MNKDFGVSKQFWIDNHRVSKDFGVSKHVERNHRVINDCGTSTQFGENNIELVRILELVSIVERK